ncbi:MAG: NAD-dependent succinate-semialdehyde dehydrogenase [Planctomycetota bacterium]|nr:NAD-dependent succinate-semialdehyde dehydrogenase [Planctomycetota bacterium]
MLIDGRWVEAADGGVMDVMNPATEEVFAQVAQATEQDVDKAAQAADAAFEGWSRLSPAKRADYLRAAGELAMQRCEEIGRTMTEEQGKPLLEAQGEVQKAAGILRYYAEEGERIYGRIVANAAADTDSRVIYQPIGPTAAISPWNYPVELIAWKAAGALAAGCTMVAKPPSLTPLSPLMFLQCLVDAGVPAGVVNATPGPGRAVGQKLITSSLIKKVAFTGSTEIGRKILADCGPLLKKVSLELGGHCPLIVCRDCDLDAAVQGAVRRSFRNMGQICIAINRIYVEKEIHDDFLKRFVEATGKLVIGNGLAKAPCDLGPMANREGVEKAQTHIANALEKGAKLACGGKRPEGKDFQKGFFFEPTVLTKVNHEMLVMREETFGPVVGIMPFGNIDEAIALANDTPYGLACYAFTNNLDEADRLARRLRAGNVAINNVDAGVINAPYGGWNESGMGHEHGPEGLYEYLAVKHVRVRFLHSGR